MTPPSRLVIAVIAATSLAVLPTSASEFTHVIAPGESLSSVAATDGLTVEELAAANGLSVEAQLIAGTGLTIPEQGATPVAESGEVTAAAEPASASGGYIVQPGDTLSAIAAREGTTVDEL